MKTTDLGHPKSRLDTPRKQPPNGHLSAEPRRRGRRSRSTAFRASEVNRWTDSEKSSFEIMSRTSKKRGFKTCRKVAEGMGRAEKLGVFDIEKSLSQGRHGKSGVS